jgi:hypothetical protein
MYECVYGWMNGWMNEWLDDEEVEWRGEVVVD